MENQIPLQPQSKSNQSGFAMVSALILLPLLFTLLASGLGIYHVLYTKTKEQTKCYRLSLSAQGQLKIFLRQLISLNPKARKLRKLKLKYQLKLAKAIATGQKELAVYFEAEILKIHQQQVALSEQQNLIIQGSEQNLNRYKNKVESEFKSVEILDEEKALAVYRQPNTYLAPEYLPVPQFRKRQALLIKAKAKVFETTQNLLKSFKLLSIPPIEIQCGGSLIKKGRTWIPVLEMGK